MTFDNSSDIVEGLVRLIEKKKLDVPFKMLGVLTGGQGVTLLYFYFSRITNDQLLNTKAHQL